MFPASTDVSPGPTIWLFTWRGTSRAGWPRNAAAARRCRRRRGGKKNKQAKPEWNKRHLPTNLLVELSQSRVAGVCSSQSMPFCTILKLSACGTSLWRKALWRLSVATRKTKFTDEKSFFLSFFFFFFFYKSGHPQKKKTTKKKIKDKGWMIGMYGAWCFWGHLHGSRYTGTLRNCRRRARVHCECLRLADRLPRRRCKG